MDIVDVADVEESVARFGDRYLTRVYTPRELVSCAAGADARRLAALFAAKEATLKTLGGDDETLDWRSIEVTDAGAGAVAVALTGEAAALASRHGIVTVAVSVDATRRRATAVALAETTSGSGGR